MDTRNYQQQGVSGFYDMKTAWLAEPRYAGPLLIRGQQLDGPGPLGIGEVPPVQSAHIPSAAVNVIDG